MTEKIKIIECVPNFSEGRDVEKIDRIIDPFRHKSGVKLIDYQKDPDQNRMVVTVAGEPEALTSALLDAVAVAVETIDMRNHRGQHPRMGAVDVIPVIPIKQIDIREAIGLAASLAAEISTAHDLPVFLYEASARTPERKSLEGIRKGEFEGMADKFIDPAWKPDFGPAMVHPTAGVTAVGARMPQLTYHVSLGTEAVEIADQIARRVDRGLGYCKRIGVQLKAGGTVQIALNLTCYENCSIYQVLELVRVEARRYGINIVGSEIVGVVPMASLIDTAGYYLGLENFSLQQILEEHLLEI